MALIKCPECKNKLSTNAVTCPHCGFPLREAQNQYRICQQNKKKDIVEVHYKYLIPLAILCIISFCIFSLLCGMTS